MCWNNLCVRCYDKNQRRKHINTKSTKSRAAGTIQLEDHMPVCEEVPQPPVHLRAPEVIHFSTKKRGRERKFRVERIGGKRGGEFISLRLRFWQDFSWRTSGIQVRNSTFKTCEIKKNLLNHVQVSFRGATNKIVGRWKKKRLRRFYKKTWILGTEFRSQYNMNSLDIVNRYDVLES